MEAKLFVDRLFLGFGENGDGEGRDVRSVAEGEGLPQPKIEASGEAALGDLGNGLFSFGDPSMVADCGESSMYVSGPSSMIEGSTLSSRRCGGVCFVGANMGEEGGGLELLSSSS